MILKLKDNLIRDVKLLGRLKSQMTGAETLASLMQSLLRGTGLTARSDIGTLMDTSPRESQSLRTALD